MIVFRFLSMKRISLSLYPTDTDLLQDFLVKSPDSGWPRYGPVALLLVAVLLTEEEVPLRVQGFLEPLAQRTPLDVLAYPVSGSPFY